MGVQLRGLEVCLVFALLATINGIEGEEKQKESVITLDHSNFGDIVSKYDFILVEFYAPWYISSPYLYFLYLGYF